MVDLSHLDPSEGLALVTDGSAWTGDGSGAWAWLVHDAFNGQAHDSGKSTEDKTTNNRMEMMAWVEGLTSIHGAFGPCHIIVYSDSEYVGLGAIDRKRSRVKNVDIWELLDAAVDRHLYVEYHHVKGHSGHRLNNLVDRIASETRRK